MGIGRLEIHIQPMVTCDRVPGYGTVAIGPVGYHSEAALR